MYYTQILISMTQINIIKSIGINEFLQTEDI